MLNLTVPWPHKNLNPNRRVHWSTLSKLKKSYRKTCYILAKEHNFKIDGKAHIYIDFYPPDKRHRDMDNVIAAMKSCFDGIADAIQVNDVDFVLHPSQIGCDVVKNGKIEICIKASTEI